MTLTMTRNWTCPDCGKSYVVGNVIDADTCCGRAVMVPPTYKDRVQVSLFGKSYTYLKGSLDLQVGDWVRVPMRKTVAIGEVTALESQYAGKCLPIIGTMERRRPTEESAE